MPKLPPPPLPLPPPPPPPPSSLVLEAAGLASGCSFLGAAAASSLSASSFCLLNFERFDVGGSAATTAAAATAAAGAASVGGGRCGLDSVWWRRRLGAGRRGRRRLGGGAGVELVRHLAGRIGGLRIELVPLGLVVEQPAARRGGGRCSGRGGGGGSTRGRGACSGRCGRVVTPIPLAATLSFGAPKLPRLRSCLLHLASSARRSAAPPDQECEHKPAQAESHLHALAGSAPRGGAPVHQAKQLRGGENERTPLYYSRSDSRLVAPSTRGLSRSCMIEPPTCGGRD